MEITILATIAFGVFAKVLENKLQRSVHEESKEKAIESLRQQYSA